MAVLAGVLAFSSGAAARTHKRIATARRGATADNAVMLTVFLKHDQSRPRRERNAQLQR